MIPTLSMQTWQSKHWKGKKRPIAKPFQQASIIQYLPPGFTESYLVPACRLCKEDEGDAFPKVDLPLPFFQVSSGKYQEAKQHLVALVGHAVGRCLRDKSLNSLTSNEGRKERCKTEGTPCEPCKMVHHLTLLGQSGPGLWISCKF